MKPPRSRTMTSARVSKPFQDKERRRRLPLTPSDCQDLWSSYELNFNKFEPVRLRLASNSRK